MLSSPGCLLNLQMRGFQKVSKQMYSKMSATVILVPDIVPTAWYGLENLNKTPQLLDFTALSKNFCGSLLLKCWRRRPKCRLPRGKGKRFWHPADPNPKLNSLCWGRGRLHYLGSDAIAGSFQRYFHIKIKVKVSEVVGRVQIGLRVSCALLHDDIYAWEKR